MQIRAGGLIEGKEIDVLKQTQELFCICELESYISASDSQKAIFLEKSYMCVSECTWRSRNVNFQGAKNYERFVSSAHRRQHGGGAMRSVYERLHHYTTRSVTGHPMLQDMLCYCPVTVTGQAKNRSCQHWKRRPFEALKRPTT